MERFRNFYETLGLTRAASEVEIAQAYRAQLQKLQSNSGSEDADLVAKRLSQLEEAYRTLTHPASRKKHDEEVAWQATKRDLDAEEARRLAWRLKEEQELAEHASKAAQEAAKAAAIAAELKGAEEARRLEEQVRIDALAAERFRPLKSQRSASESDFVDTVPEELLPVEPLAPAPQTAASSALAIGTVLGCVLFVLLCFGAYLVMRPAQPQKATPQVVVSQPVAAPASAPLMAASEPEPEPPAATANSPAPSPATKVDTAKAEEARQYQKALQRVEREHPELNPRHGQRRDDLIAFVASRVKLHVKEGYSRAKALEIAVRDLEMQEQTRRLIESVKAEKPKPATESPQPVLDPGGHTGFDPKCRWVTQEQWSCK